MNEKQKPTNVELVMSVSGIRDLVGWLEAHQEHIGDDNIMNDYVNFLKGLLKGRDNQI